MKKIILGASAALAMSCTSMYAGGTDASYDKPYVSPATDLYIQLQLGIRRHDYKERQWSSYSQQAIGDWHGGTQSMAYGGDFGYEFSKSLSFEMGAFYFPQTSFTEGNGNSEQKWRTYSAYGALKATVPVLENVDLFLKAGLGWTHIKRNVSAGSELNNSIFAASASRFAFMGGFGFDYNFAQDFFASGQYLRFVGENRSGDPRGTPVAQNPGSRTVYVTGYSLYMAGIGYKFAW